MIVSAPVASAITKRLESVAKSNATVAKGWNHSMIMDGLEGFEKKN